MRRVVLILVALLAAVTEAVPWPVVRTYQGETLRRVKMPMGGVGTGTISLSGNGELVDWEIRGTSEKGYAPSFGWADGSSSAFWIRTEGEQGVSARLLAGPIDTVHYEGGEGTAAMNRHYPRFESCTFSAAYPLASVDLTDRRMPVRATLEAMNPLVPGDLDASSIPAILLRWRIRNETAQPLKVSLLGLLANPATGKMIRRNFAEGSLAGVEIGSDDVAPVDCQRGRAVLTVPTEADGAHLECGTVNFDGRAHKETLWSAFVAGGDALRKPGNDKGRSISAAALTVGFSLAPGEERSVPFVLAWRFPHRYGWTKRGYRSEVVQGEFSPTNDVGNFYATRYATALDAARTLFERLTDYEARTVRFVRSVLDSPAPPVVQEAALFNLSTLRCETCFRTADGHFFGWEGVFDRGGSCYGNCTHVWGYEHALVDLWPELAKDMTELQFGPQMDPSTGHISFRVGLPLAANARSTIACADGQMQCIVKAYENWRKTGDDAWVRGLYPRVRKALEFCWIPGGWDADRDGVMEGCQHNTMDCEYYGPNPQMEFLYLAALKAMAAMADFCGDGAFAATCRDLAAKGSDWTEKNLFNGSYYRQIVRPVGSQIADGICTRKRKAGEIPDLQLGEGVLIDQLLGDCAARHVGLGAIADERHARLALETVLTKCATGGEPVFNHGRCFAFPDEPSIRMAWYPEGTIKRRPFPYYTETMTGFEYVLATCLAQRGDFVAAEKIVADIRSRYDGRKRNPFDEAECGHHYVRALAAWTVLRAFIGAGKCL